VHRLLSLEWRWGVDEFVDWIYRELFLMPPDDPLLGLDIPDPFSAVPPPQPARGNARA
jgi:hypothetical protein